MNLFVSTTFLKDGTSIESALELCKKNDIYNIELGSNHSFSKNYEEILKNFDFKYIMHNYFPIPKDSFVLNLASLDDEIFKRSIKHVKNALDLCVKINCKLYTVHPGFLTDPKGPNKTDGNYDFQWNDLKKSKINYEKGYDRMLKGLEVVVNYANKLNVKIAIETEGSVKKHNHLLMQKPEEFQKLFKFFDPSDLGINLNIGHLNLAKKLFKFQAQDFISLIENYIVAMELSHNTGEEDDHLPLIKEGWYWDAILDKRFVNVFKILEFRNSKIIEVIENINLFKEKHNAIQIFK